jgi:hypothetical protein
MGGRGVSSATSKNAIGLPNGAVALTITFQSGRTDTFYESDTGILMKSRHAGSTYSGAPVAENAVSLKTLYERANKKGYSITLHSASEIKKANKKVEANKEQAGRAVAYGEMHPNEGKTGISAKRLVYRPRRNKW